MWIKTEDRLPEVSDWYIVQQEEGYLAPAWYSSRDRKFHRERVSTDLIHDVTAWQALSVKQKEQPVKPEVQLSFRDTVNARLACFAGESCDMCPLAGGECNDISLGDNVNGWLKYILGVLDSRGQDIEDISADDWLNILG